MSTQDRVWEKKQNHKLGEIKELLKSNPQIVQI